MKKIIWFTTISILFLVFLMPAVMASVINMIPSGDQPGYDGSSRVSIYGEYEFKQKFVSKYKNLVAVGTSIKNPNLANKKEIIFNLYDENNTLIRSAILSGKNIEDGDFVKFVFDEVNNSTGKTFIFTISSKTSGPGEIIEVFLVKPTPHVIEYSYNKETKEGGAPIVTFHKPDSRLETIKLVYLNLLSRLIQ
jgi:hypothetical protein